MKRDFFSILPFFLSGFIATAQSLSPQVNASSGSHFLSSNAMVSFTIGEPLTTTLQNSSAIFTQGFHQTFLSATMVSENTPGFFISVFPNPSLEELNINFLRSENPLDYSLRVMNVAGQIFLEDETLSRDNNILFSNHADGIYILEIFNKYSFEKINYKIIKQKL